MSNAPASEVLYLGNNETLARGVIPQTDGTFLALTFSRSKVFKTQRGAVAWLARAVAA